MDKEDSKSQSRMKTRSQSLVTQTEEDQNTQVPLHNMPHDSKCYDNVSCHGSMWGGTKLGTALSSKHSSCGSNGSTARTKLMVAQMKERQLARQFELEDKLKEQERQIRMQRLRDEVEVAQLIVEAEESELVIDDPIQPQIDRTNILANYLQDCTLESKVATPLVETNVKSERHSLEKIHHYEGPVTVSPVTHIARECRLELPKVELSAFFGEVTDYWRFVKQFEFYIEARVSDPGQRLLYLMNYCKGAAREEIKNCIMLPPEEAYAQARKRLTDRYGQPHIIARTLINDMLSLPRLQSSEPILLAKMASALSDCKLVLSQMNYIADLNSVQTLGKLVSKLPVDLRQAWSIRADGIYSLGREPNVDELIQFIEEQARIARSAYGRLVRTPEFGNDRLPAGKPIAGPSGYGTPIPKDRKNYQGNVNMIAGDTNNKQTAGCFCCRKAHPVTSCTAFMKLSVTDRWELVKKHRICFLCLSGPHMSNVCKTAKPCEINHCSRRHHQLLHQDPKNVTKAVAKVNIQKNDKPVEPRDHRPDVTRTAEGSINAYRKPEAAQLGILPVILRGPKTEVQVYAMLDTGSDLTLIRSNLLDQLGLEGTPIELRIRSVTGESKMKSSRCNLQIASMDREHVIQITEACSVDRLLDNTLARSPAALAKNWPHLADVEFNDIGDKEVSMLIGCDTPEAHWVLDQRLGGNKQPFAVRTMLGWLMLGPRSAQRDSATVCTTVTEETELWDYMRQLYDHEFEDLGGIEKEKSIEEKKALDMLERGTVYENARYTVPLPWKEPRVGLPNNLEGASKRLHLLGKRFIRSKELWPKYKAIMDDHLRKGYIERVGRLGDPNTEGSWFLPHHPVFNPKKPGKVRVVFDCAARYKGTSLNDCLLPGPDTIADLVGVLLRFRKGEIALAADIEEMFLQVKLPSEDRMKMRFLWWDTDEPVGIPSVYQMTVHPFGATSSPFCANFALTRTTREFGKNLSEASLKSVRRDIYVDDCITSVSNLKDAILVASELTSLFRTTGFRLRKWISNSRDVLQKIPQSECSDKIVSLTNGQLPTERTLGVEWDTETDRLKFTIELEEKPNTRRGILSSVASMFDPLGLLSPFTLVARILLQDICRQGKGWDELLAAEEVTRWEKWKQSIPDIRTISIPRRVLGCDECDEHKLQLHIFSDASEKGYGVAVYIRSEIGEQQWEGRLLMAKARVAPIKKVTVPRLELNAAVLASRVYRVIVSQLDLKFGKIFFWTDSVLVLRYIRNTNARFVTFVANRVQEILECSTPTQWKYVNTKKNPADMASRGVMLSEEERVTWFGGPPFLREPEDSWTNEFDLPECEHAMETKGIVCLTETVSIEPFDRLLNHYSSWVKLARAVAWLRRWRQSRLVLMRKATSVKVGGLDVNEIHQAELDIIRYVQKMHYPEEWKQVIEEDGTSRKRLLRRSTISKLNPIARDGLLCVGGRLLSAPMSEDRKYPIILPRKHPVTDAIVWDLHRKEGHSGVTHLLGLLRDRFWIVNGRSVIRKLISKCITCRRLNAPLSHQQMAPLPEVRVDHCWRPFSYVGVDCFGPFFVKRGRLLEKRYGCMFTCMQSRAVHVELTHSLSMDSFLLALSRFVDRRGTPVEIYSDNGGNFIGADVELRKELSEWDCDRLERRMSEFRIRWTFNPPAASHRGGVWERMIRSVRRILYAAIGAQSVEEELLFTYLIQAERIINDRPLVPVTESDMDTTPLRPSDLLRARDKDEVDITEPLERIVTKRWKSITVATQNFWNRWRTEYLTTLQLRQKWLLPARSFRVGDTVIIWTESVPKGCWPLGVITEVETGVDGLVRTVSVRTGSGTVRRDVRKICLIEGAE